AAGRGECGSAAAAPHSGLHPKTPPAAARIGQGVDTQRPSADYWFQPLEPLWSGALVCPFLQSQGLLAPPLFASGAGARLADTAGLWNSGSASGFFSSAPATIRQPETFALACDLGYKAAPANGRLLSGTGAQGQTGFHSDEAHLAAGTGVGWAGPVD